MMAWGWHLLTLIKPDRVIERLLLWPLSLALLAGALAGLICGKGLAFVCGAWRLYWRPCFALRDHSGLISWFE